GSTGTTTASARSRNGISSCAMAPAAASTTTYWVSSGSSRCQPRAALLPSIGSTALSRPARFSAQRVAERCGSASTSTVRWPARAAFAARCVAMVDLPTPPLELATRIVFIRYSADGHEAEAYHHRRGPHSSGEMLLHVQAQALGGGSHAGAQRGDAGPVAGTCGGLEPVRDLGQLQRADHARRALELVRLARQHAEFAVAARRLERGQVLGGAGQEVVQQQPCLGLAAAGERVERGRI